MKNFVLILTALCVLSLPAFAASKTEQRGAIQEMRREALTNLYHAQPGSDIEVRNAVGYAVFTSADIAAFFVSGGYGHGIAHDNRSGEETYMQMASAGLGLGLGVKDFNTVFIFNNADSYADFVNTGLDLSGHVDVAAKQGSQGDAIGGAEDILPGVKIYQLTDTGLLAQVMLKGSKYWQDSELNNFDQQSQLNRPARTVND